MDQRREVGWRSMHYLPIVLEQFLQNVASQNNVNVYYLAVCVGHSGVTELGASGLGFLMRLQLRYQQGLHHLKAWLGLEDLLPRWLTHVIGELVVAAGRRPLFSKQGASPKGCLRVLLTWQLVFPETVIQEPAGQSCSHFCDLALEVIHLISIMS